MFAAAYLYLIYTAHDERMSFATIRLRVSGIGFGVEWDDSQEESADQRGYADNLTEPRSRALPNAR